MTRTRHWTAADIAALRAKRSARPAPPPAPMKEKDLQAAVEAFLTRCGYWRMTAIDIALAASPGLRQIPCRGFFGHWFDSQRNAFVPDLVIIAWPNTRPPLLLELKTRPKYQPGQREAIRLGLWREARTLDEAAGILADWAAGGCTL